MEDVGFAGEEDRFLKEALGRIAYLLKKGDNEVPEPPMRRRKKQPDIGECCQCDDTIKAEDSYFNADGKLYHEGCFACAFCDEAIPSEAKHFFVDGQLLCEADFRDLHNPTCKNPNCGEKIADDEYVKTEVGKYHIECFNCTMCNKPLATVQGNKLKKQNFVIRKKKLFCLEHGVKMDGRICFACTKPILDVNAYETVSRRGQLLDLHTDCFKCKTCGISIENQEEVSYLLKDNEIFCAQHGNRLCTKCQRPIANAEGHNTISGLKYHRHCTPKCLICKKIVSTDVQWKGGKEPVGGYVCVGCTKPEGRASEISHLV